MRDLRELDKYRDHMLENRLWGMGTEETRRLGGAFIIPTKGLRKGLKVVATSGEIDISQGWEHVSVSTPIRCPDWNEMSMVKSLFFHPHEVCFQLHPAESENISNHNYCLHIWRNIYQQVPLPPPEMVGVKNMGGLKPGQISLDQIHQEQDRIVQKLGNQTIYGRMTTGG